MEMSIKGEDADSADALYTTIETRLAARDVLGAGELLGRLLARLERGERVEIVSDAAMDGLISTVGVYTDATREAGGEATERLVFGLDAPPHLKQRAAQNRILYLFRFPHTASMTLDFERPQIDESERRFRALNPSIVRVKDGYRVICRTVNSIDDRGIYFASLAADGIIRTRNFFLTLNSKWEIIAAEEMLDETGRVTFPSRVLGFEDCRLFLFPRQGKTEFWCTATVADATTKFLPQVGLVRLAQAKAVEFHLLVGPHPGRVEKNWLPFESQGELRMVYGFDPVTILRIDLERGATEIAQQAERTFDTLHLRGGAPPIPFDGGYLAVTHEVIFLEARRYAHRFVWFDADWNLNKVTPPFYFVQPTLEYCAGLCEAHETEDVIVSVGIEDAAAYLFRIAKAEIRARLKLIPYKAEWNV